MKSVEQMEALIREEAAKAGVSPLAVADRVRMDLHRDLANPIEELVVFAVQEVLAAERIRREAEERAEHKRRALEAIARVRA